MFLLLALVVIIIGGLVVFGAFGTLSSSTQRGERRSSLLGGTGPMVALVGAVIVVVLFGLVVVGAMEVRGGRSADEPPSATAPPSTAQASVANPTTVTPATTATTVRTTGGSQLDVVEVVVTATDPEAFGSDPPAVDELASRAVLRVVATGFISLDSGVVEQCSADRCWNSFPVLFDEGGIARFQYLVRDTVSTGDDAEPACRAATSECVVRVRTESDTAFVTTAFGAAAPPPRRVKVTPFPQGVIDGTTVTVAVTGFEPGERVHATMCAAPDRSGTARCGAPSPVAAFTIVDDGTGRTELVIREGRVGSDEVVCGRSTRCGIVVVEAGTTSVPGPVVPVTFSAGPGAAYEGTRVLIGVALAALLLALAWWLVRITDWRKPTEADTPEMDSAAFAEL